MVAQVAFAKSTPLKSIFLLADSQLLFWSENGQLFLDRVVREFGRNTLKAAYIGASNGDQLDFYSIFVAAMEGVGVLDCRMIPSNFAEEDRAFLNQSDVILLAGGDVDLGWRMLLANGIDDLIVRRFHEGATLIGVSAGAVQLGVCYRAAEGSEGERVIKTLNLVPFIIGAHEESDDWKTTKELLHLLGVNRFAIGLPKGGGAIYHPDHTVEPIRYPLHEFSLERGETKHAFHLRNPDVEVEDLGRVG